MNPGEFIEAEGIQMQKIINEEINQDGIYEAYVRAVAIDGDYNMALKLNQEISRRVSKIFSESEGDRKKHAELRLELLTKTAKDMQLAISKPNYNQEKK